MRYDERLTKEQNEKVDVLAHYVTIGAIAVESGTPEQYRSVGLHKLAEAIERMKK